MESKLSKYENIINFSIFGKNNSGKCSLNKAINLYIKDLSHPKDFIYNNTKYHIFPIPCCGGDLKDNFDISIKNSDFIIITIDSNDINSINNDINYYSHLILLSIINDIKKIIFVVTKKNTMNSENLDKVKLFINNIYEKIKNKFKDFHHTLLIDYGMVDSLEGDGIEDLLNKFPNINDINKNENKDNINNNDNAIIGLYDKYFDKEREEFVITCKINNCTNNEKNISVNETLLNIYYIDNENLVLKKIEKIIPFKLSLSDGEYINKLNIINNQFISLKFKLNLIDNQFMINPYKNIFLSFKENNENICFFDTFESDIIITSLLNDDELKEKTFTVITKGCTCLFSSYNIDIECNIINIIGEYENENNNLVKKKIINCKNGIYAKILINLKKPILATKYDFCNKFGSFKLIKSGITFAVGKINKYKPKK